MLTIIINMPDGLKTILCEPMLIINCKLLMKKEHL